MTHCFLRKEWLQRCSGKFIWLQHLSRDSIKSLNARRNEKRDGTVHLSQELQRENMARYVEIEQKLKKSLQSISTSSTAEAGGQPQHHKPEEQIEQQIEEIQILMDGNEEHRLYKVGGEEQEVELTKLRREIEVLKKMIPPPPPTFGPSMGVSTGGNRLAWTRPAPVFHSGWLPVNAKQPEKSSDNAGATGPSQEEKNVPTSGGGASAGGNSFA